MSYKSNQSFNDWNKMLGEIYDKTQNYSKSAYEIHCHLTEVTGGFGKYFIKKREYDRGKEFLASIFAWGLALIRKVTDNQKKLVDVDQIIFKKFPGVCPYCLTVRCTCIPGHKSPQNYSKLKLAIDRYTANNEGDRVNKVQAMLAGIYEITWDRYSQVKRDGIEIHFEDSKEIAHYNISYLFSRMTEELAEIAEAIRFYHLYKSNFENEIADFFAWYFAIVSIYHQLYDDPDEHKIDLESLLWESFPGVCFFCSMPKCVCRPGPVRELLSKPSPEEYNYYDEETQTENRLKLDEHIRTIEGMGEINKNIFPISTIKITISNYSKIKNKQELYLNFLSDLSSILRKKIRYDKDKYYRKKDDELFILSQDTIKKEAEGLKERIEKLIRDKRIQENYSTIKFKFDLETYETFEELKRGL